MQKELQTEAICSGSALFAQTCLSEKLGTLRYIKFWFTVKILKVRIPEKIALIILKMDMCGEYS